MLSIRRWLDEGGVAGLLADRTLPGNSQRSKAIALPFLGAPAFFPDGPFRLAAMLRRRVVFMAGLYRGGRDYDLRFVELADFSRLAAAGAAGAGERDAAVRAAMERYVATLEALVPRSAVQLVQLLRLLGRCRDADHRRARRPERRRFLAATIAALGLAGALALAPRAAQAERSTSAR